MRYINRRFTYLLTYLLCETWNCYLWDTKWCFRNFGDINKVP